MVSPPQLWVEWGLVDRGVTWTLDKAVYGLRQSPRLWSDKRDSDFRKLRWKDPDDGAECYLEQSAADRQFWHLKSTAAPDIVRGVIVVYVDDILLLTKLGSFRDAYLAAMKGLWTFGDDVELTVEAPLTFLGITMVLKQNGDIFHRYLGQI